MKMSAVVRRKLMMLTVGQEVDLRTDGIPFSVHRPDTNSYRLIPHIDGVSHPQVQRVRCHTRHTCLEKLTKALGLEAGDEELE